MKGHLGCPGCRSAFLQKPHEIGLFLVTVIVALAVAWVLDHWRLAKKIEALTPHALSYPAGHPLGPLARTIAPHFVISKEDDPFADLPASSAPAPNPPKP